MSRSVQEEADLVQRQRLVGRVLWIVLLCNLGVAAAKIGISYSTGALAVLADGIHALMDASANLVGLLGVAVAARPPDAGHPYGHRRFETLAALGIGLLILLGMLEVLRGLLEGVRGHRVPPVVTLGGVVLVAMTVAANVLVSRFESQKARELGSALLDADASHTWTDALGALAVLVSFVAVPLGFPRADLLAAALVVVLSAQTALRVLRLNLAVLTDQVRLDPQQVRQVAMNVEGVRGAHKIRSRGGLDDIHVDMHIHLDPQLSLVRAHAITHAVVDAVRTAFPAVGDVIIHTEPADGRELDTSTIAPGVGASVNSIGT